MAQIKLRIPKNSSYYCYLTGQEEYLRKDYWTTIDCKEENPSDSLCKYYAKKNLMIQVAIGEWGGARYWHKIQLDNADIEVVRE